MTQQEVNGLIGKNLLIRDVPHLCLAAGQDSILLLQLCEKATSIHAPGDPVQYIVAKNPGWYRNELIWGQGHYYPVCAYQPCGRMPASAQALRDASIGLCDMPAYLAFTSDESGTRCAGVYTKRSLATYALESWLRRLPDVKICARSLGKESLTIQECQSLYVQGCITFNCWIAEMSLNGRIE